MINNIDMHSFLVLGFVTRHAVVAMMILLSLSHGAPVDKHSTHCEVSKTARGLIKHLLPMSVILGGDVYRLYVNVVSLIFFFIHQSSFNKSIS